MFKPILQISINIKIIKLKKDLHLKQLLWQNVNIKKQFLYLKTTLTIKITLLNKMYVRYIINLLKQSSCQIIYNTIKITHKFYK